MPGPVPKPAGARARTNRAPAPRTLTTAASKRRAPKLPEREWHPSTKAWWRDVWASPMAAEWDPSDLHGLVALAVLIDDFWSEDDSKARSALAAEIRRQRQCFGLTPIDRRRLQWEVDRAGGEPRLARAPRPAAAPVTGWDPRAGLLA
jgi:hypothetical protein